MESVENTTVKASRKYKSYTFEDRLRAISMKEAGMSSLEIGERMGIDSSLIRGWVRRYRKDGTDGLKPVSHRRMMGANVPDVRAMECPPVELNEFQQRKGFIHYVDNPGLMRSMTSSLAEFGVSAANITVGSDASGYADTLEQGDTVVVNSLFDFSNSLVGIMAVIVRLMKKGVSIVSISDCGITIGEGGSDVASVVSVLSKYADIAEASGFSGKDSYGYIPLGNCFTERSTREQSFRNALELYSKGCSMTHATRVAGCSYSAFRYWYNKQNRESAVNNKELMGCNTAIL